jgi:hypothetical protein
MQLKLGDYKRALSSFEKVLEVHPENCESLKVKHFQFNLILIFHSSL